jgi:molecular chaperone HscA
MSFHVVQGERELVSDCRSLARFELRGIPPMSAGAARVQVTFQVDADGLLSITAKEKTTGVEASIAVKPSYGLTDADIERMLRDSFEHARDDMQARVLHENRVDGERLADAVRTALDIDGRLIPASERDAIEHLLVDLRTRLGGEDHRAIKQAADALNRATEEFASRRMDASVRKALAGQRIADLER